MSIGILAFDIETSPLEDEEIERIAPEFDPASVKTGNLSDFKKINDKINLARESHLNGIKSKAALNAEYGKILAIGMLRVHGKYSKLDTTPEEILLHGKNEGDIIQNFWDEADKMAILGLLLVGHNIIGFDCPFLVRRSYCLGIKPPFSLMPQRGKYWGKPWFDTMGAWTLGGYQQMISLDRFSKHLGLDGKNGDGKHFATLYRENKEEALDYLSNDLKLTMGVAQKIIPLLSENFFQ